MLTDQRTHYRVLCYVPCDVFESPEGEKKSRVIVKDVSFSGLCVESLEAFEPGETIYVDFSLAGRYVFNRVPVMVSRSNQHGGRHYCGLNFRRGEDRRKVRQALVYLMESAN